jgi:hypothetical protein
MVSFACNKKTVNKTKGSTRVFQGGNQHTLIEVAGNYMVPVAGVRTLPCHVIKPVMYLCNGCRILSFVFYFHIHLIANGYGIGAGNIVCFKYTPHAGFPGFALLIGNAVPASCGFVNGCSQGIIYFRLQILECKLMET